MLQYLKVDHAFTVSWFVTNLSGIWRKQNSECFMTPNKSLVNTYATLTIKFKHSRGVLEFLLAFSLNFVYQPSRPNAFCSHCPIIKIEHVDLSWAQGLPQTFPPMLLGLLGDETYTRFIIGSQLVATMPSEGLAIAQTCVNRTSAKGGCRVSGFG